MKIKRNINSVLEKSKNFKSNYKFKYEQATDDQIMNQSLIMLIRETGKYISKLENRLRDKEFYIKFLKERLNNFNIDYGKEMFKEFKNNCSSYLNSDEEEQYEEYKGNQFEEINNDDKIMNQIIFEPKEVKVEEFKEVEKKVAKINVDDSLASGMANNNKENDVHSTHPEENIVSTYKENEEGQEGGYAETYWPAGYDSIQEEIKEYEGFVMKKYKIADQVFNDLEDAKAYKDYLNYLAQNNTVAKSHNNENIINEKENNKEDDKENKQEDKEQDNKDQVKEKMNNNKILVEETKKVDIRNKIMKLMFEEESEEMEICKKLERLYDENEEIINGCGKTLINRMKKFKIGNKYNNEKEITENVYDRIKGTIGWLKDKILKH